MLTQGDMGGIDYNGELVYESDESLELNEIGIDDTLCNIVIPCLVKANIWQEVEPEMAQLERNKGLQNLSMMDTLDEEPYQSYVSNSNVFDWSD